MALDEIRHTTVLDIGLQKLGTVYARALLGATEKAGNTDGVLADLRAFIVDVLDRLPKFEAALTSPRVPFESKERLLDRSLQGKVPTELLNFLKVLARRGRLSAVRAVEIAARKLLNELRGRWEVHLTTAAPLDQGTSDLIVAKLRSALGRDIDLRTKIDPELIGGLVVRVGDTVYDGSIVHQLQQLRTELGARAAAELRGQSERLATAN